MAMESGGGRDQGSSPPPKPSKFSVNQIADLSAALNSESLRPSNYGLLCIFFFSSASAFSLLTLISRENGFIDNLKLKSLSHETAYLCAKAIQTVMGLVFFGTVFSLFKAISLRRTRNITGSVLSSSKGNKEQMHLTNSQLVLLGIKPKVEQVVSKSSKRPPMSRPHLTPSSDVLVPLHQPMTSPNHSSRTSDRSNSSGGNRMRAVSTPSKSPSSLSSLYIVPGAVLQLPSVQSSPGVDSVLSTPWSSKQASSGEEITSEEKLEKFLAEVDEKITESAGKMATPPPIIGGFGIGSPNAVSTAANTSGTTRSTPLRPVRMSPGSQKFSTPPKKRGGDLPPPMSMEESVEAFEHLGIYPQIEQWRDRLRQWFSSVLLNPLCRKIETCHIQGRIALWDSILLLCHRAKVGYGGIVRGMHLGSSSLSILPILDSETED